MIQFLKAIDECTVLAEKKKTKKITGRTANKEQVFQDFLVDMFASQQPVVNRIKFDGIEAGENGFSTEKKDRTTLYD